MSKVVIKISSSNKVSPASTIIQIAKITGKSLHEVKNAFEHQDRLAEYVLFMNDYVEVAQKIKNLVAILQKNDVQFELFDINPADQEVQLHELEKHKVSAEVLHNILENAQDFE